MKKLLVAVVALASVSAFSQSHMVRFSAIGLHNGAGDFNVGFTTDEEFDVTAGETVKTSQTNIALNYAYTVAPQVQVGLGVIYNNGNDEKSTYYNVSAYYNFSTDLANAYYAGLHYQFGEEKDVSKDSNIFVEGGKRFALGSWNGFNLTYAPNVTLGFETTEFDAAGVDDSKSTTLAWNFLKFDVLF